MHVKTICEPLVFSHVYSSAPWGGEWLRCLFARTDAPEVCSESWEISAHPHGMSVVTGGAYDGRTFVALFVLDGGVKITSGGVSVDVMRGNSALVPAAAGVCTLKPRTAATRLIITTLA